MATRWGLGPVARRPLAPVLTAALMAVLAAGALMLGGCTVGESDPEPAAPTTSPPDGDDTGTTEPEPEPEPLGPVFTAAEVPDSRPQRPQAAPRSVVAPAGDLPLTVVGFVEDPEINRMVPAVWEGDRFETLEMTVLPAIDGLSTWLVDVVAFGDTRVAVGGAGLGHVSFPVAFVRAPGGGWEMAEPMGELDGSDEGLWNVDVAGDALIGSGFIDIDTVRQPALWHSTNGAIWSPATIPAPPTDESEQTIIAAAGNGEVSVAVGWEYSTVTDQDSAVLWRSEDGGRTWRATPLPESMVADGGVTLTGVVWHRDRFLVIGTGVDADDQREAGVWTSSDGVEWALVDSHFDREGVGHSVVNGVGAAGLTTGDDGSLLAHSDNSWEAIVWRSTDGRRWERVGDIQDSSPRFIPLGRLAQAGDVTVNIGEGKATILESNGRWASFEQHDVFPVFDNAYRMTDVAATQDRVVVVGEYQEKLPGGRTKLHLWSSPDGVEWIPQAYPGRSVEDPVVGADDELGFAVAGQVPAADTKAYGSHARSSADGETWTAGVSHIESFSETHQHVLVREVVPGLEGPIIVGGRGGPTTGWEEEPMILRHDEVEPVAITDAGYAAACWSPVVAGSEADPTFVALGSRPISDDAEGREVHGSLYDPDGGRTEVTDSDGSFSAGEQTWAHGCLGLSDGSWLAWGQTLADQDPGDLVIWRSDDGITWRDSGEGQGGERLQSVTAMVETPDGFLVVGRDESISEDHLLWWWADGVWHHIADPVDHERALTFAGVTLLGDTVILVGADGSMAQTVWTAPLADVVGRATP